MACHFSEVMWTKERCMKVRRSSKEKIDISFMERIFWAKFSQEAIFVVPMAQMDLEWEIVIKFSFDSIGCREVVGYWILDHSSEHTHDIIRISWCSTHARRYDNKKLINSFSQHEPLGGNEKGENRHWSPINRWIESICNRFNEPEMGRIESSSKTCMWTIRIDYR